VQLRQRRAMALHLVGAEQLGAQRHVGSRRRWRSGMPREVWSGAQQSRTQVLKAMHQFPGERAPA
jgi:hypothetical protein